jgi:hypothetical protein
MRTVIGILNIIVGAIFVPVGLLTLMNERWVY